MLISQLVLCPLDPPTLSTAMAPTITAAEEPAQTKNRTIEPLSQPVLILNSDTARLYTHIHPVLLPASLYFLFPRLVSDPVYTLSWTVIPLTLLQMAYCMTCLPPSSGSSTPQSTPSKTPKRKRVQFAKTPVTTRSKAIVSRSIRTCVH